MLVLWAALVEVRTPGRWPAVLGILSIAGLLRPEAWVLSAAYILVGTRALPLGERLRAVALGLSAPAAWLAADLALTGDPLFSLHGTRALAALLGRPRGTSTAIRLLPQYLRVVLGPGVLWCGMAGLAAWLIVHPRAAAVPTALVLVGVAAFLAYGVAGLPLLTRYLQIPCAMLSLGCAYAVGGWSTVRRPGRRRAWLAAAVIAAVVVAAWIPSRRSQLSGAVASIQADRAASASLHVLLSEPGAVAIMRRCGPPRPAVFLFLPDVADRLDLPPERVAAARGLAVVPAAATTPSDGDVVAATPFWRLIARCRAGAST